MKTTVAVLSSLAFAFSAFARIGDTLEHSIKRYGPVQECHVHGLRNLIFYKFERPGGIYIWAGLDDEGKTKAREQGLGFFVRSLVGLERDAAKQAFAEFLSGRTLTSNQIEFIDLIINYLTEHGAMEPERLYESPFTDFSPLGVEGIFQPAEVTELLTVLENIRTQAA